MSAFGSIFMPDMSIAWFDGQSWSDYQFQSSDSLTLHPGAHILHYASSVFEGLKAFKHADGSVHIFRIDQNVARFAESSRLLGLPTIDTDMTTEMIIDVVKKFASEIPAPPGSMYIRPTHIGTEAIVGKAAAPSDTSCQYILLSPVGDYFTGGDSALSLLVEEDSVRCAPHMGMVKSGGNYASALHPIMQAKQEYGVDQILFCPNGDVQETGASNFLLIDGDTIITKNLDPSFLHGVTRISILSLAEKFNYKVEERTLLTEELFERIQDPNCEAALSGTAAVLTSVGSLIRNGERHTIGSGKPGKRTIALRKALNDIQWGNAEDSFGWLTKVC